MLTARQENQRTLARLVGISEEEAAKRLGLKVVVRTEGVAAKGFAHHVSQLLAVTLEVVGVGEQADLELAVNVEPKGTAACALSVAIDAEGMRISVGEAGAAVSQVHPPHDLAAKLAACYAAGGLIRGPHPTGARGALVPSGLGVSFAVTRTT